MMRKPNVHWSDLHHHQDARYLDLLRASVESLKLAMPELPVTVFSQFPIAEAAHFDKVVTVQGTSDGFYDKARLMLESPYERTLFIDADIYVAEAFSEVFTLLDRFDCAATHEEYVTTDWFNNYPRLDIPASFPEFNTGILAYRHSDAMRSTLRRWSELYQQYLENNPGRPINDQPFFRAAAYYGDARMATLPREYNCKFRGQGYLNGPVKLLHAHVKFKMKLGHMRRVLAVMNASMLPRVYIAGRVYEQKITGRRRGRRKVRRVGAFPEPESLTLMRLHSLREMIKTRGINRYCESCFLVRDGDDRHHASKQLGKHSSLVDKLPDIYCY